MVFQLAAKLDSGRFLSFLLEEKGKAVLKITTLMRKNNLHLV